ncbi:MAG TPA: hypothetical protein DD435_01635 [Cyanobacteria bacterium UBA8530]|nr:hypothetical protein [Cyanobacteria bacterium UBA8530]
MLQILVQSSRKRIICIENARLYNVFGHICATNVKEKGSLMKKRFSLLMISIAAALSSCGLGSVATSPRILGSGSTQALANNNQRQTFLKSFFRSFDIDKNNSISLNELCAAKEHPPLFIRAMDVNKDGFISWSEFQSSYIGGKNPAAALTKEDEDPKIGFLKIIFYKNLDTNLDGKVSLDELSNNPEAGPEAGAQMIKAMDKDGDSLISWEEFLAFSLQQG